MEEEQILSYGDSLDERNEFVELVAQAVLDKMEEKEKVRGVAAVVARRVRELQLEESRLRAEAEAALAPSVGNNV